MRVTRCCHTFRAITDDAASQRYAAHRIWMTFQLNSFHELRLYIYYDLLNWPDRWTEQFSWSHRPSSCLFKCRERVCECLKVKASRSIHSRPVSSNWRTTLWWDVLSFRYFHTCDGDEAEDEEATLAALITYIERCLVHSNTIVSPSANFVLYPYLSTELNCQAHGTKLTHSEHLGSSFQAPFIVWAIHTIGHRNECRVAVIGCN